VTSLGIAVCGALAGLGLWRAVWAVWAGRPQLAADIAFLDAPPRPDRAGPLQGAAARLTGWLRRVGLARLLLADDLALVGRDVDGHTAVRMVWLLAGAGAGLAAGAAAVLAGVGLPPAVVPLAAVTGGLAGVATADRPVRRLAAERRREAALAVAAFVDLARILLVGGLPLHTALRAAADTGSGWAFTRIAGALDAARERGLPPDAGLAELAGRLPVPAFADLRRTVASARRGASPVVALESRAASIRAAEAAQSRGEEAAADAQMELPAAAVAVAFVGYLTYPLLTLVGAGTVP
jgi:hypothetical protein